MTGLLAGVSVLAALLFAWWVVRAVFVHRRWRRQLEARIVGRAELPATAALWSPERVRAVEAEVLDTPPSAWVTEALRAAEPQPASGVIVPCDFYPSQPAWRPYGLTAIRERCPDCEKTEMRAWSGELLHTAVIPCPKHRETNRKERQ